ncbi:MAG: hypothetical protein ABIH49_01310 [archaeon]
MNKTFLILLAILILPAVSAANLEVNKTSSNEVIVQDVYKPAVFDLKVKNLGDSGNFEFYNLLGFSMAPKGTVFIGKNEVKDIQLMIYPKDNFNYRGFYTLEYLIRAQDGSEQKEKLTVRVIDMKEAFEVGSGEIDADANSIKVYIHNAVNFDFGEMSAEFSSPFFNFEENFSLSPYEKREFDVKINKEDFKKLMAGFYTLNAKVNAQGKEANVEGVIKFAEKDIVTTIKKNFGLIINTQVIEKRNEGNVVAQSETVVRKNIISRLFTTFSPEPDIVDRQGWSVYYTWSKNIMPGENLQITVRTNWIFPFVLILLVIAIVLLAKQYSKTNLVLRKKVSFVKVKGGEFALKVSIMLNAKKYVERVTVVDRIPPLMKIYEKFGGENPKRVDERTRRIEWDIGGLEQGETRVLSYIVYSKVGVMGKFALPEATAIYERDGEIHESISNRAFFVAEQRKKDIEE